MRISLQCTIKISLRIARKKTKLHTYLLVINQYKLNPKILILYRKCSKLCLSEGSLDFEGSPHRRLWRRSIRVRPHFYGGQCQHEDRQGCSMDSDLQRQRDQRDFEDPWPQGHPTLLFQQSDRRDEAKLSRLEPHGVSGEWPTEILDVLPSLHGLQAGAEVRVGAWHSIRLEGVGASWCSLARTSASHRGNYVVIDYLKIVCIVC